MIWSIIAIVAFVAIYILIGVIKSGKQMYKLQEMASSFSDDFKIYIYSQRINGWEISEDPANKSGWYKLNSGDGTEYYIRFNGPIPFKTAVDLLMKGFMHKVNNEEL